MDEQAETDNFKSWLIQQGKMTVMRNPLSDPSLKGEALDQAMAEWIADALLIIHDIGYAAAEDSPRYKIMLRFKQLKSTGKLDFVDAAKQAYTEWTYEQLKQYHKRCER